MCRANSSLSTVSEPRVNQYRRCIADQAEPFRRAMSQVYKTNTTRPTTDIDTHLYTFISITDTEQHVVPTRALDQGTASHHLRHHLYSLECGPDLRLPQPSSSRWWYSRVSCPPGPA